VASRPEHDVDGEGDDGEADELGRDRVAEPRVGVDEEQVSDAVGDEDRPRPDP